MRVCGLLLRFQGLDEFFSGCFCCLDYLESGGEFIVVEIVVILDGVSDVEDGWFGGHFVWLCSIFRWWIQV